MEAKILPAGDGALVVEFGRDISEETNRKVQNLSKVLVNGKIKGIVEVVPTFRSLMISYNPAVIGFGKLKTKIERLDFSADENITSVKKTLIVPCCYEDEFGPDLEDMEKLLQLSKQEIINMHSGRDYLIYMLGFLPGFVYLGGMEERIEVPRLETPRTKIPARSVGIGGSQTGVYPVESPGGWRLIGRTPIDFYNPQRHPEILCEAGEYIRFAPVDMNSYKAIREDVKKGVYSPEYAS